MEGMRKPLAPKRTVEKNMSEIKKIRNPSVKGVEKKGIMNTEMSQKGTAIGPKKAMQSHMKELKKTREMPFKKKGI